MAEKLASVFMVGKGGREFALARKLHQSPRVGNILFAPGNGGTEQFGQNLPFKVTDKADIVAWAREFRPDLTVVGPEAALFDGMADDLRAEGLDVFGPGRTAAMLTEGSKIKVHQINARLGIPQPDGWYCFEGEHEKAKRIVDEEGPEEVVLKGDGPGEGKAVVLPATKEEAYDVIDRMMIKGEYLGAGKKLLIQRRIKKEPGVREASVFALADGRRAKLLRWVPRDYKPKFDDDLGPNTGGMGGWGPVDYVDEDLLDEVDDTILQPYIKYLAETGNPFIGVLYAGLMLVQNRPRVLEFNCRWGDPEADLIMPMLEDDLYELSLACAQGRLDEMPELTFKKGYSLGVVAAADNYPSDPKTGMPITGVEEVDDPDTHVVHAGTKKDAESNLVVDGGRVLLVYAYDENSLEGAHDKAYARLRKINFDGIQYRHDIGLEPKTA